MDQEILNNLRKSALKLIAYKEYTEEGLKSRLTRVPAFKSELGLVKAISQILEEFKEKGWVSDQRAVDSLLNQKAEKYGINRINEDLKRIGAPKDIIEKSLLSLKDSEHIRAKLILEKRFNAPPTSYKEVCKQKNYLHRKGFSFNICNEIVDRRKKIHL